MGYKAIVLSMGILTFVCSFSSLNTDGLPKYAEKKALRIFEKLWPTQVVRPEQISLKDHMPSELVNLKRVELYRIVLDDGSTNGYMFLCAAPSRHDYFDLLIIFQPNLTIATVEVLVYREDYGGEIGSQRWLKQFISKSSNDAISVDHDIQGIAGATISVHSATSTIKVLTSFIKRLSNEDLLFTNNN